MVRLNIANLDFLYWHNDCAMCTDTKIIKINKYSTYNKIFLLIVKIKNNFSPEKE